MEGSGGSINQSRGRGRGAKRVRVRPFKTRRAWSAREEEVLITSIKDLLGKGWKSDNGFKAGYLNKLEAAIVKAFPGTDLKGMPHIHSKLTGWKRTFASLASALSRSGVGWNEKTNMLDCDDETWHLVVKADKNAEHMRFKSFPLYPVWLEIYGKDRANGQRAEDVLDAYTNLLKEDIAAGITINADEYDPDLDEEEEEDDIGNSVCAGDLPQVTSKNDRKRKKVTTDGDSEQLRDLITSIVSNTNELKEVTRFIGYEHGLGQKREAIFSLLTTVNGLTDLEMYDLVDILSKDSDRLEAFNGLPDEHKRPYLKRLLQRIGGLN